MMHILAYDPADRVATVWDDEADTLTEVTDRDYREANGDLDAAVAAVRARIKECDAPTVTDN